MDGNEEAPLRVVTLAEKRDLDKQKRQERIAEKEQQKRKKKESICNFLNECVWIQEIEEAPVYAPTLEEFQNPIAYIQKIQTEAAEYGICKIIPPVNAAVPGGLVLVEQNGQKFTFTARTQEIKNVKWDNWDSGPFFQNPKKYTFERYEATANEFAKKKFGTAGALPPKLVEAEYWRQREQADTNGKVDWVDYGNDVEGSMFSDLETDPLGSSKWNLQVLGKDQGSALRLLSKEVPGVSDPMLYIGMLYATFAWHVEDHYLYSINYHHLGAPKTWYGVPAAHAEAFETVAKTHIYHQAIGSSLEKGASLEEAELLALQTLLGKTTMFTPKLLLEHGVRVVRAVQNAGEFIVTFPRAYHSGFSHGFNCGEAVNFATCDWFPYGAQCSARYRKLQRMPIIPHEELLCLEVSNLIAGPSDHWAAAKHSILKSVEISQPSPELTLVRSFVRLIRWQHKCRHKFKSKGVQSEVFNHSTTVCFCCKEACYLAYVRGKEPKSQCSAEFCLRCAARDKMVLLDPVVMHNPNIEVLEDYCRQLEPYCCKYRGAETLLGMEGLREAVCQEDSFSSDLSENFSWHVSETDRFLVPTQSQVQSAVSGHLAAKFIDRAPDGDGKMAVATGSCDSDSDSRNSHHSSLTKLEGTAQEDLGPLAEAVNKTSMLTDFDLQCRLERYAEKPDGCGSPDRLTLPSTSGDIEHTRASGSDMCAPGPSCQYSSLGVLQEAARRSDSPPGKRVRRPSAKLLEFHGAHTLTRNKSSERAVTPRKRSITEFAPVFEKRKSIAERASPSPPSSPVEGVLEPVSPVGGRPQDVAAGDEEVNPSQLLDNQNSSSCFHVAGGRGSGTGIGAQGSPNETEVEDQALWQSAAAPYTANSMPCVDSSEQDLFFQTLQCLNTKEYPLQLVEVTPVSLSATGPGSLRNVLNRSVFCDSHGELYILASELFQAMGHDPVFFFEPLAVLFRQSAHLAHTYSLPLPSLPKKAYVCYGGVEQTVEQVVLTSGDSGVIGFVLEGSEKQAFEEFTAGAWAASTGVEGLQSQDPEAVPVSGLAPAKNSYDGWELNRTDLNSDLSGNTIPTTSSGANTMLPCQDVDCAMLPHSSQGYFDEPESLTAGGLPKGLGEALSPFPIDPFDSLYNSASFMEDVDEPIYRLGQNGLVLRADDERVASAACFLPDVDMQ